MALPLDATKVARASKGCSTQAQMVIKNDAPSQRSYILRLWVEVIEGEWVWRFSLEDTFTSERKGFARLEELYTFIQAQLQEVKDE